MDNENTLNNKMEANGDEAVSAEIPVVGKGQPLTVRDDQHDHAWLLDAARLSRRKGVRFRLVDSGVFDRFQLEWLLKAGVDFFSSDDARSDFAELEGLRVIGRACGGRMAYFLYGEISPGETEGDGFVLLGQSGIDLHVSSRDQTRDPARLAELAGACREGKARLVYYHHGGLDPDLEGLVRAGAWIHMTDASLREEDDLFVFDLLETARKTGSGFVLHLEKELEPDRLQDLMRAGVRVLFKIGPIDYRSPMKPIEKMAARRRLPDRSFFLYPDFMP